MPIRKILVLLSNLNIIYLSADKQPKIQTVFYLYLLLCFSDDTHGANFWIGRSLDGRPEVVRFSRQKYVECEC